MSNYLPIPTRLWTTLALLLLGLALVLIGCTSDDQLPSAEPSSPTREQLLGAANGWNLVLITVDTLRADHLGSFGYQKRTTSTNIDGLVQQGIRFLDATAPRASTWPSLATVLTGLYPSGHGVTQNHEHFHDEQATLPKVLNEEGYLTGAFLSNMCDANHGGWQTRQCSKNTSDEALLRNTKAWLEEISARTAELGEGSKEDSDKGAGTPPVFLWTHFFGSHGPYFNGGTLAEGLDPDYQGIVRPKKGVLNRIMTEPIALNDRDLEHLDAVYDASIIGTDRRVGRLLQMLEEHLDLDRTVIVFLADHGEELYEHNQYLYHACSVYQSTLHVPLAIVAPGLVAPGEAVAQPVELSDVFPTILDLLGVKNRPQCIHGEPLLGYLAQPNRSGLGKLALSEYGRAPIGTVRHGSWKLVSNPLEHQQQCLPNTTAAFYTIGKTELYNLAEDPREAVNLASEHPERVSELSTARRKRIAGLCQTGLDLDRPELSEDQRRALKTLGYVAN